MDDTEIAWAAGFFDGEGHMRWHRTNAVLSMQVGQAHRQPLERFLAVAEAGKIHLRPKATGREYWAWEMYGADNVHRVYGLLRPYLCDPKRAQGDTALATYASRVDGRKEGAMKREAAYRDNPKAYPCPECGFIFTRPNVLTRHRRIEHA